MGEESWGLRFKSQPKQNKQTLGDFFLSAQVLEAELPSTRAGVRQQVRDGIIKECEAGPTTTVI